MTTTAMMPPVLSESHLQPQDACFNTSMSEADPGHIEIGKHWAYNDEADPGHIEIGDAPTWPCPLSAGKPSSLAAACLGSADLVAHDDHARGHACEWWLDGHACALHNSTQLAFQSAFHFPESCPRAMA